MKRAVSLIAVLMLAWVAIPAHAGEIDPGLQEVFDVTPAEQPVSAMVVMSDRVDVTAINTWMNRIQGDRWLRHMVVVEALQDKARATQGDLVAYLESRRDAGAIEMFEAFWIANLIRVDAVAEELIVIADRGDVELVYFNIGIEGIKPVEEFAPEVSEGGINASMDPEPGIKIIGADRVWNELGITGDGVLVATLDTGVDGNHPALKKRWRGLDPRYKDDPEWAWFDPVTSTKFPQAFGAHGTHTMGTVCGGDPGNEVGVAPGAQWIHAAVIDRVSIPRTVADAILSFQWMVDPDGDSKTDWDVPQSCSNSWRLVTGHGYPPCDETFWEYLDACEAAGVIILFSAGNEGPGPRSVGRPPDRATTDYDTLAVGACDGNNPDCPIASFSSRGPSKCTPNGQDAIKPEITGPGVNVRSSMPGGGYGNMSGTSMASPHLNGVVALMREANKNATSEEIKQVMYDTATDKGPQGEDNTFGWGLVNAYEAVTQVMGGAEPAACCFSKGTCKDLKPKQCRNRGGRSRFNETCGSFDCPQPGACCIDNSTCEKMLERDCLSQGGDFKGEGEKCRLACPCDLVKKFKVKCSGGGTISALVKFKDKRRDGEKVEFRVGERLKLEVTIIGKKAKLYTCCFNGPTTVALIDPEGCVDPIEVKCPE